MGKLSLLHTTLGIIINQRIDVAKLIREAHRLGIKVIAYARGNNLTVRDADVVIVGQLNDKAKLKEFATQCQVVTYMNGSGISGGVVNYLRQFTDVPQGTSTLDLVNDRSIQRVFLDSINIKSLPYDTVFSIDDVQRALNKLRGPILLRPVQTDYFQQRDVIITDSDQLSAYKSMFNGEAYLIESLPLRARYFKLNLMKSSLGFTVLPIIEEHYNGQKLSFANTADFGNHRNDLARFNTIASTIANHINYAGMITISFILTNDDQIYVDGINSPFNIANNVYNLTPDNVYQMFLRLMFGLPIQSDQLQSAWLIKMVSRDNLTKLTKLWVKDRNVALDLSSLVSSVRQSGFALISAKSLNDAKAKLQN